ncbi:MAG: endonuclease/exonuclease/phosphatase family protein [Planctomycetes bacterium]|nr:endonuclease/exonuclease/phosphatase family protein [Planctomycetota bacterium]
MPRSYSVFLIAILAGGGWFFTTGPGKGKFGDILKVVTQNQSSPNTNPQVNANQSPLPGYYSASPQLEPAAPVQAHYANFGQPAAPAATAAPAPMPPSPMNGGPAIRIASFNIQVFGEKKASNPEVMWTLAAIVHNFQIVAIQEIRTQDDYFIDKFLSTYVNQNGRAYDKVVGPRLGRSSSKEQYAFLYDTATIQLNHNSIYTVNDPDDMLHREPLVAMFRTRGPPPEQAFTFVLVNIHTDPDETLAELDALAQVYQAVRRASGGEDDIILLGDLNVDDQHLGQLGKLDGVRPLIRGVYTNTRQNELFDNIVLHQPSTAEFSGRAGVYHYPQLYQLPPQQALEKALKVSDHLPVWAEFSAYEAATPGRVAGRPAATIRAQ